MLLKDDFSDKSDVLTGVAVLVLGVAIGLVISPGAWLDGAEDQPAPERSTSGD